VRLQGRRDRLWRIGKSFVFIDFRRKNPEVAAAAGRGVGVKPRPQASERAHRHEPLRSGKGSFAARARRLAARPPGVNRARLTYAF